MKIATIDIETDGFLDVLTRVWCAVGKDHQNGDRRSFTPDNIDSLCDWLDTFDVLIGHNCIGFDFPALRKVYGWEYGGKVVDTLLMSRLQKPNRMSPPGYTGRAPHSVEAWGHRLGAFKKEHEDWDHYSPEMLERCEQDVDLQYKIYHALLLEGRGQGWGPAHRLNAQIFTHLQRQEEYGWPIDIAHMDNCISTLDRWIDRISRSLVPRLPNLVEVLETKKEGDYSYVKNPFKQNGEYAQRVTNWAERSGVDRQSVCGPFCRVNVRTVNLDSNMEVKEFLLEQGWRPDKWNTDKDGKRTSAKLSKDDPFDGIQGSMGRLVAKRIQCRHRKSNLEGWRAAVRADGRIGAGVGGIASTGRLKHKLIVNVPSPHSKSFFAKQMRQCFIAQPGWVLVGCDSKGNQMRQLAGRMDDDEFTEAVLHGSSADGTDLHSLNQRKSGAATRSLAKNFFYGSILFGAGDAKTAQLLDTTKDRAKKIKEDYMNGMPKLKALISSLQLEWKTTAKHRFNKKWNKMEYYGGFIRGVDGRPIRVEFEKDLLCYALQSDEAIQMGLAYVKIHEDAKERGWIRGQDWGMLIWMHDEVQMECRPEIAEELGQKSNDAIKWAGVELGMKCPHDGDYMVGRSWYDVH